MASAFRLMHSLILVWFLSPFQLPNSQCGAYSQQRCKHQYCCAWDCILQILFSSFPQCQVTNSIKVKIKEQHNVILYFLSFLTR